jgi:hypothetical protein
VRNTPHPAALPGSRTKRGAAQATPLFSASDYFFLSVGLLDFFAGAAGFFPHPHPHPLMGPPFVGRSADTIRIVSATPLSRPHTVRPSPIPASLTAGITRRETASDDCRLVLRTTLRAGGRTR